MSTAYQDRDHRWVYLFAEGSGEARELLGGKGAELADMTRTGLPVPPGFVNYHRGLQRLLRLRPPVPRRH